MTDVERKDFLDGLIADCPIPVEFHSIGRGRPEGEYWHNTKIVIDSCSTFAEAIGLLFHELKHVKDHLEKSLCFDDLANRTIIEYSAMLMATRESYKLQDKDIIQALVNEINFNVIAASRAGLFDGPHYKAAIRIQKTIIYHKCLSFLGAKP